ncbi:MAG TPA: hypothetical protein VGJ00_01940 [Rhabdochlamydiaceae bacterium]|jgi:hypothetical protein
MRYPPVLRRFLIPCVLSLSAILHATTLEDSDDIDQKDIYALREWINTKRQVTIKELGGALSLSAEVRTELQTSSETLGGIRQRGRGAPAPIGEKEAPPTDSYDIEVNIMLDYRTEKTWSAIKLEFDNAAGIISGTLNKIKLERAFWGIRTIDTDQITFDIEVGRRRMSSIVDSKLEFDNFFDGVWLKYDQSFESIADFYLHAGAFLVNESNNQFGYLGEFGMMNVGGTGFYTKYSLVDWDTKDFDDTIKKERFDFLVSQLLLGYRFFPATFNRIILLYIAGLYNHNAKKREITDHKKANLGGYVGLSIGELKKKGDWAFDVNYQVLQAQCVPDFDVGGIGLGNAANTGFYATKGVLNTRKTAGGNVNYRGFQMVLDWLLTNQLNFQQSWQQSITLDKHIGKFHRYKQYEIEFIYSY